jgi:hypothetical protein
MMVTGVEGIESFTDWDTPALIPLEPAPHRAIRRTGPQSRTRIRPRSMTTVPSCLAVWNLAPPSSSQMETTSVSPGTTGWLNRPDMEPNRAGSEPQTACSSARPVIP